METWKKIQQTVMVIEKAKKKKKNDRKGYKKLLNNITLQAEDACSKVP